jgi:D-glycero-alpha-D-manno-heptose 1-phosphate guanylyltransferase
MAAVEAIILAGGLGTRLRDVVPDLPKPLAPVAGRPFLAWLLDAFAGSGMRRVILATGYLSEQIEDFAGGAWQGMEIAYSRETERLGTGGAVGLALQCVQGDGVHVVNGDTWLRYAPRELEQATRDRGCALGIALARVDDVGRYGAVEVEDGRVRGFREKGGSGPGLINAGAYFLTAEAMARLPDEPAWSFEQAVLVPWASRGDVAGFTDTKDFIDIGVPEDYARAQRQFGAPS